MYNKIYTIFKRDSEQQTASFETFFSHKLDSTNLSSLENRTFRINSPEVNKIDDDMLVVKIVSSQYMTIL